MTPLNATTSNLSAPPINSPDPSPSADESSADGSFLRDGAVLPNHQPSYSTVFGQIPEPHPEIEGQSLEPLPTTSTTIVPSPLSQQASADLPLQNTASHPTSPVLLNQKSKRLLAKEVKAAEKLEAKELAERRAEEARAIAAEKKANKKADAKAKEEVKQKKEEEKIRLKMEKKTKKLQSTSHISLPSPYKRAQTAVVPPVPLIPAALPSTSTPIPIVRPADNLHLSSPNFAVDGHQRGVSMPIMVATSSSTPVQTQDKSAEPSSAGRPKLGLLGALRKRFSVFGPDVRPTDTPSSSKDSDSTAWTNTITPFPANPSNPDVMEAAAFLDSPASLLHCAPNDSPANWPTSPAAHLNPDSLDDEEPGDKDPYSRSTKQPPHNIEQTPSSPVPTSAASPPSAYFLSGRQDISTLPYYNNADSSAPVIPQSSSHQSTSPIVITVPKSPRNAEDFGYSGSPTRQNSPTVRGPRAMHSASRPHADSIGTTHSAERQIAPGLNSSGLPFVPRAEIVTPSTSGESSGFNRSSDFVSPFASEDSRQSSMTSEGFDVNRISSNGVAPLGREVSKDLYAMIPRDVGSRHSEGNEYQVYGHGQFAEPI